MWMVVAALFLLVGIALALLSRSPSALDDKTAHALAKLDSAAWKHLRGEEVTDEELATSGKAIPRYHELLSVIHGTENNMSFSRADRAEFYVAAIKAALVGHPEHSGWPFIAGIRRGVLPALKRKLVGADDPFTRAASITPALLGGEVEFAVQCYRRLEDQPALARTMVRWVRETLVGYTETNDGGASRRFLESIEASLVEAIDPGESLTPERRWALVAGVYPSHALDPRSELAAVESPAACRFALESWWGIVDERSAKGLLRSLLDQGHRAALQEDLRRAETHPSRAKRFVVKNRRALERYGIVAWDACRMIQVIRSSVRAGFLREEEAWEFMLRAAEKLRETYPGWREMGDDYVLGSGYFEEGEPNAYHRRSVEWLQRSQESPWQRLSWSAGTNGEAPEA